MTNKEKITTGDTEVIMSLRGTKQSRDEVYVVRRLLRTSQCEQKYNLFSVTSVSSVVRCF